MIKEQHESMTYLRCERAVGDFAGTTREWCGRPQGMDGPCALRGLNARDRAGLPAGNKFAELPPVF